MKRADRRAGIYCQWRCVVAALTLCTCAASSASAAFVTVYGGPAYDATTSSGYQIANLLVAPGSSAGNGVGVGSATKYSGGANLGLRPIRWDISGSTATELGNLGTSNSGSTSGQAYAVNYSGTAVGYVEKYTGGTDVGTRPVRWDASGTSATELGTLGSLNTGYSNGQAFAINAAGTAVGWAGKFTSTKDFGPRAVRWAASGTTPIELGTLGTDSSGTTDTQAYAINAAGTTVGWASKYVGFTNVGYRAVRWNASGTAATELGNIGTDNSGSTSSQAYAVNTAGTAVGWASKYTGGTWFGERAVRWNASGTAATELSTLGTSSSGFGYSEAYSVNDAGTAVGFAQKYSGGTNKGFRAVRWDASESAATELGNLGTSSSGVTSSEAFAINTAGTAVGFADKYSGNTDLGRRAVLWQSDAVAFDLNTLIDPNSGWTLTDAVGITDTNWVTGYGNFDPDGAGPLAAYLRGFLLNVSTVAVPEPSSIALVSLGGIALLRLRRRCPSSGR